MKCVTCMCVCMELISLIEHLNIWCDVASLSFETQPHIIYMFLSFYFERWISMAILFHHLNSQSRSFFVYLYSLIMYYFIYSICFLFYFFFSCVNDWKLKFHFAWRSAVHTAKIATKAIVIATTTGNEINWQKISILYLYKSSLNKAKIVKEKKCRTIKTQAIDKIVSLSLLSLLSW